MFQGYKVTSFSNGYYKYNEAIYICDPSLWQNDSQNVTVILSIQTNNLHSINLVNGLKINLSSILDDRLDVEIQFANIDSLSQILGRNVTIESDTSLPYSTTLTPVILVIINGRKHFVFDKEVIV